MEDIFKDLPSLCDPRPFGSLRGNQGKKKDHQAMKYPAARPDSKAGQVPAGRVALPSFVLIGRSLQTMARAVALSWQRIKAVGA